MKKSVIPQDTETLPRVIATNDTVTDTASGVTGKIIAITSFKNSCTHVEVQRNGLDNQGEPRKSIYCNALDLEGVTENMLPPIPDIVGKKVIDQVTGQKGTVVSYTVYDNAAPRLRVQPYGLDKDGNVLDTHICDLADVVRDDKVPVAPKKPGGPASVASLPSVPNL